MNATIEEDPPLHTGTGTGTKCQKKVGVRDYDRWEGFGASHRIPPDSDRRKNRESNIRTPTEKNYRVHELELLNILCPAYIGWLTASERSEEPGVAELRGNFRKWMPEERRLPAPARRVPGPNRSCRARREGGRERVETGARARGRRKVEQYGVSRGHGEQRGGE